MLYHNKYLKYKNKYCDLKGGGCHNRITVIYFTSDYNTNEKVENKIKLKYDKDDYILYYMEDKYDIFGHIDKINGTDIVLKQHLEDGSEKEYNLSTKFDKKFELSTFTKEDDGSMNDLNSKIEYLNLGNGAKYLSENKKYNYLKIKYDGKVYFGRIYPDDKGNKLLLVYIFDDDGPNKFIILNDIKIEKIQDITFYIQTAWISE